VRSMGIYRRPMPLLRLAARDMLRNALGPVTLGARMEIPMDDNHVCGLHHRRSVARYG